MSLKSQLKELATPISSAYAIDVVRRKSLVYEDPKVVDGLTCLHECSKAFEKLCQMDADLIQFRKTLFSASTLKIEMCNLLPAHKAKIDQQVSLFLFMMSPHVRSAETLWALEFQIHLNYVDQFLMFLLPYYETGLFAKCIQLLDFQQSASQWQWLQPYADRGVPVSRLNFLKLCRSQPTLVPFIATLLSDYAKMESSYSTNRIQTVSSFFVSTVTGLCDAGLSDSKMAKIVSALQGVIRQGLRSSKLPSFQSAAILATARIAMKLRLNTSLVLDWIECILKHTRKGSEWESIRLINVLMRTQSLVTLPDKLSDLHQHLTNTLSPVERSILEAEEAALLEGTDLNAVAAEGLQTSERVQKATLLIDSVANEEDPSIKPMHVVQVRKKPLELLSAERLSKINFTELFADDEVLLANINFLHGFLASEPRSLCIMRQFSEVCSCPPGSLPTNNEWLSEILQRTVLRSITADIDSISPLEIHKAKAALQLISLSVDSISPQDKSPKLQKSTAKKDATKRALNFAFPCLLVTLVHPVGQLRVKAYELVRRCTRLFTDGESATHPDFANVAQFLHDAQEIDMPDCLSNLLLGDSLWALYKNASNFVRAVFRLLCRGSGEREHPLAPSVSVAASVDTIFHCLSVYKQSPTIQLQGVLCLIEVASLYPAVLCHNLITLVQLVSSSNQFLRLDDKHNLSLLGRLISIAVPALVRASGDCAEAAFRVLSLFIRGLTDLPANLPRRCLAVYVGLLRGLSRVATPVTLLPDGGGDDCQSTPKSPATPRRTTKQASLQSWLWVSALMFINVDWPSQETADLVFPLLIDLFNQFDVGTQVAAWYQCLDFFLQLTFSPASDPLSPAKRNSKRMRLQGPTSMKSPLHAVEESQGRINSKLVIKYLAPEETAEAASAIESTPLLPGSRKRPLKEADCKHQKLSSDHVWRLLAQASALFSSLLESSGHEKRREDHQDPQILSRTYGTVVRHVVSLMVEAASTGSGHSEQSTDESLVHPQAKQALHHLQSILIKTSLMRKALELLLAKLSSLTAGCPSATALLKLAPVQRRRFSTARPPTLDETLEGGLVTLAVQLSEPVTAGARLPTERSQIKLLLLRLSCLRELAQLLCNGYPAELLKMLDSFIERPLCWWLASSNSATTTHVASSAAEARSLICLFGVECIARLPAPLTSLGSESTGAVHRVQCLLRFAVDHASTACRLSTHPTLLSESAEDYVVGKIHYREQHLQASLTLILGVLEFCAVNAVDPQASLLQRLRSSSPTRLDLTLLALAFRLTHLDLAAATVAKLDRSASALKQCSALVKRITLHLVRCPDSLGLLTLIKELFKGASIDSDMHLVSGGLDFLAQHSDFIRTSSASAAVDLDDAYAEPSENLPNAIETAYVANPSLIWRLLSFALQCRPSTMTVTTTDPIRLAACSASASLLASLNRDYRLQLLSAALRWTVSTVKTPRKKSDPDTSLKVPPVLTMLFRLESVFRVLERLSAIISPEAFTVLVKNANLINLFVSCLSLLSGQQKSKDVRKMARALELPDFVDSFRQLDYSRSEEHRQAAVDCLRATLACTAAWLQAEAKLSACLDTAGTDVVLALPSALVSSLRVGYSSSGTTELDAVASPPVTEVDLVPAVDAFLKAIGGDEALLRPFGSALCALCSGRSAALNSHWRTRLAALRLLKQTFDTLVESQDQISDLGVASCLVGDTLAALSEALEDDRPEVEAAANRLFADLEAVGATVSQT
nr:unnamed protein product [Spirometra erinaceieuropaei]